MVFVFVFVLVFVFGDNDGGFGGLMAMGQVSIKMWSAKQGAPTMSLMSHFLSLYLLLYLYLSDGGWLAIGQVSRVPNQEHLQCS